MKHIRTASYPASNGMIQRIYRQLKAVLRFRQNIWIEDLPIVLLSVRASYREAFKSFAAELEHEYEHCVCQENC